MLDASVVKQRYLFKKCVLFVQKVQKVFSQFRISYFDYNSVDKVEVLG